MAWEDKHYGSEPWWRQVGWLQDPTMDCWFSVSPDGVYERMTGYMFMECAKSKLFIAPRWFEELYPDWRDQIII